MGRHTTSRAKRKGRLDRLERALYRERSARFQRLMCEAAVVVLLVVVVVSAFHRNFVGVFGFGLPLLVGIGWLVSQDVRRRLERGVERLERGVAWLDSLDLVWHLVAGAIALGSLIWSAVKP